MSIFATAPSDDEGIELTKKWCRERGYTPSEVSIKKTDEVVFVEVK